MRCSRCLVFGALLAWAACQRGGAGEASTPAASIVLKLSETPPITEAVGLVPGAPVGAYGQLQGVAAATDGSVHLIAWSDSYDRMSAARVRVSDGAVLDTAIRLAADDDICGGLTTKPAVAFTAGVFLVVWPSFTEVCAVRLRPDGTVLDRPARVIANVRNPEYPAVSGDGQNFLVVWGDGRTKSRESAEPADAVDIYGGRVRASDGAPLDGDGFAISTAPGMQTYPAAAFDGSNFVVVWTDRSVSGGVFATRIRSSDRQLLDPAAIRLSGTGGGPTSVALNSGQLLAVWKFGWNLMGRQMRLVDGGLVEPEPIVMQSGIDLNMLSSDPVLSHDGARFVAAWRGATLTQRDRVRIFALRFDNSLAAIGTPVILDDRPEIGFPSTHQAVSMSTVGGKHLVAWNRLLSPGGDEFNRHLLNVQAAALDGASGVVTQPAALVSRHAPRQTRPTSSFDGRQHLVVWHEWNGSQFQIRAARLRDSDGALLDPAGIAISTATDLNQVYGLTASNGRNHLIVWWDGTRLRGVRVRGDDGVVLDNPALSLPATPGVWGDDSPRFAVASDGQDYLVLFAEGGGGTPTTVSGLRISGDNGVVLDAAPKRVNTRPWLHWMSLTFVKSCYVASWIDGGLTVQAQRIARDGTPLDSPVTLFENPTASLVRTRVAAQSDAAVVLWTNQTEVHARRIRASDGTLLDSSPIPLGIVLSTGFQGNLAAAFDGEHLLVVSRSRKPASEFRLRRMDEQGTVLDPDGLVVAADPGWAQYDVDLSASPGRRTLMVYAGFDPSPGVGTEQLRFRWLGAPSPIDAGPPAVPPVDAGIPEPDASFPSGDAAADADPGADSAVVDGAQDVSPPDSGLDSAPPRGDAKDTGPGDGWVDVDCNCSIGSASSGPGPASLLVAVAAVLALGRRARKRGPADG